MLKRHGWDFTTACMSAINMAPIININFNNFCESITTYEKCETKLPAKNDLYGIAQLCN